MSFHHYCEWNHCSKDVKQFCHYTSPITWNQQLVATSPLYAEHIAPKVNILSQQYSKFVEPYRYSISLKFNQKVTIPVTHFLCPYIEQFEHRPYVIYVHDKLSFVLNQINILYELYLEKYVNIVCVKLGLHKTVCPPQFQPICEVLEPYLRGSKTKFQEWKLAYLNYIKDAKKFTSETKVKIQEHKQKIDENIELKKEQVKKIAKERKESYINSKKSVASEKAEIKAAAAATTTSSVPKGKTTPLLDQDIYSDLYEFRREAENMKDEDFEELDDDEEETYTSTSTIVKVVTMTEDEIVPESGGKEVTKDNTEANSIQIDFDNWSETIENKMTSIIDLFEKDVNTTMEKLLKTKDLSLKKMLRQMSNSSQDNYEEISKKIEDIDCITEIDQTTGEKIYFDKTGTTQLPVYVDRELMRDLFENANTVGLAVISQINAEVGNLDSDVYFAVESMRKQYAEIYEEWANIMVNEWSKRLAYVDVMDADSGSNANSGVSEENWKKFLKIKRQIINRRDEFAVHPVSMDEVIKFTNMVQNTLMLINRENGEYLYILRSKANLAFQKREKEEAEMAAFDAEDDEEPVQENQDAEA